MQADLPEISKAEEEKRERIRAALNLAAENKPYEIYVLLADDGRVRYVGVSKDAAQRRRWHWNKRRSSGGNRTVADWLCTLANPCDMVIIDWAKENERYEVERRWIEHFRQLYPDLLNKGQAIDPAADELLDIGCDLSLTLHLMRVNAGMTQKRLAAETGIPADMIRAIEHGRKIPHSARAVSDWVWACGGWDREAEILDLWRRTPTPETDIQREAMELVL
jgi:GIY-YIG catalytic domain/Helix-turn-helix